MGFIGAPGKNSNRIARSIIRLKNTFAADAHTNTVEGFFSIFKRGIYGIYHHISEAHIRRYLAEFDFRYSNRSALGINDVERAMRAIKGAAGKRLLYRQPCSEAEEAGAALTDLAGRFALSRARAIDPSINGLSRRTGLSAPPAFRYPG